MSRAWAAAAYAGLVALFAAAHFAYDGYFGYLFYDWRGGVKDLGNGWVRFGGVPWTWENPVLVPAFALGDAVDKHPGMPGEARIALGIVGAALFLGAIAISGWPPASLVRAWWKKEQPVCGKYYWRLWLLLLTWGWVLAPVEWTFVYQFTVRY